MGNPIRLLLVEDSDDDAEHLLSELAGQGLDLRCERVDTEADYRARLDPALDVIVSDYRMPRFSGPRALEILAASKLDIPLIVVSGTIGEENAAELLRLGASDFILKNRLGRLGQAIIQALNLRRARSEHRRLERALIDSENKFRLLWETASDAIVLIGSDNRILYANPAVRSVFGHAPDEVQGRDIAILLPARLREAHQCGMQQFVQTAVRTRDWRAIERVALHRDGHEFPAEVTYSNMMLDEKVVFAGFIHDITTRKRIDEENRQQLDELLRWQELMVGREERMALLKAEVNALLGRLGEPARYLTRIQAPGDGK